MAEAFQPNTEVSSENYNYQSLIEELDRMNRELKEMKESVLKTSGKSNSYCIITCSSKPRVRNFSFIFYRIESIPCDAEICMKFRCTRQSYCTFGLEVLVAQLLRHVSVDWFESLNILMQEYDLILIKDPFDFLVIWRNTISNRLVWNFSHRTLYNTDMYNFGRKKCCSLNDVLQEAQWRNHKSHPLAPSLFRIRQRHSSVFSRMLRNKNEPLRNKKTL